MRLYQREKGKRLERASRKEVGGEIGRIPDRNHVVVHLLKLLLGGLQGVWGRVELVGLEALVGEADSEGLVILLYSAIASISIESARPCMAISYSPDEVSTNLRDVLGVRGGGVGGDRATGDRGESLATQGRGLTGHSTEEHGEQRFPIDDGRRMRLIATLFREMLGTNFPDFIT